MEESLSGSQLESESQSSPESDDETMDYRIVQVEVDVHSEPSEPIIGLHANDVNSQLMGASVRKPPMTTQVRQIRGYNNVLLPQWDSMESLLMSDEEAPVVVFSTGGECRVDIVQPSTIKGRLYRKISVPFIRLGIMLLNCTQRHRRVVVG